MRGREETDLAASPTLLAPRGAARGAPSRSLRFAALLLLFVLPLTLRLLPLKHGGERGYVPDAHMVRQALGMARDKDLVPPVGKYSTYPNLVPYLLVPLYGVQYVTGKWRGEWGNSQEYGAHLLEHPQRAAWVARFLVAVFGALTVWAVYHAARAAGMRAGAWVASWLVATGLLHVQFSTHERPWVPLVFFVTLSAWAAIVYTQSGRKLHLALSGICAGLAFACHQSGLGAIAIPFLAWLLVPASWTGASLRNRLVGGVLAVAGFSAAGVLLGHPYLLVHGRTPEVAVVGAGAADVSVGGMSANFGLRWESLPRLSSVFVGYDPVLLVMGLAGLWFALRDPRLRAVAVFTVVWGIFFLLYPSDHARYLLPVAVLLALPAGLVAERWLAARWGRIAVPALLAVPLVQALRFDWLLVRADTRALAEERLASLAPDQRVAIDRYGPFVELDRDALVLLERVRATCQDTLRPREQHRKLALDAGREKGGVDALRVEDLLEERDGALHVRPCLATESGDAPLVLLRTLGTTHVLLVDRRPSDGRPSLLAERAAFGPLAWKVDPSSSATRPASEVFLPTEMDFPLTGLWSVNRPGPLLELVALPH